MKEYEEEIRCAVNRLYNHSGSIGITEVSAVFPDDYSQLGLTEAINVGIIINEHGRIQLRQDVFFGLFEQRMGVAY